MAGKCRLTELLRELPSMLAAYENYIYDSDKPKRKGSMAQKDKAQARRVRKLVYGLQWDIAQQLED